MPQPEYAKPIDEVLIGRVKATIWRNQTENGQPRYNVAFARLQEQPLPRRFAVHGKCEDRVRKGALQGA